MLHIYDYKYTQRLRSTYCISTATLVARTHLSVALYVHCLSCYAQDGDYCHTRLHVRVTCERQRAVLCLYHVQRELGGADIQDWLADREEWRTV